MRSSHVGAADCCAQIVRFTLGTVLAITALPALAAPIGYLTTGAGEFGTFDAATGVFTSRGTFTATAAGLGVINGTLYAGGLGGAGSLYTVNPVTAGETLVGSSAVNYDDFGATLTGLYAVDTAANLYSINTTNGAATLLGPTGVSLGFFRGLSSGSSTLYFGSGTNLYSLNTTTGAATLVGPTGGPIFGSMVALNGTLYGGEDSPGTAIDIVNTSTGATTSGPTLTGTTSKIFGLAPLVPEPSGAFAAIAAAVGVFFLGRANRPRRRAI